MKHEEVLTLISNFQATQHSWDQTFPGDVRQAVCFLFYEKAMQLCEDWLALKTSLEACCAPEPDGHGGFVADEFTSLAVLEGRQTIAKIEGGK